MRTEAVSALICSSFLFSPVQAQTSAFNVQAGLGYARIFDAGGVSFSAGLDRPLSPLSSPLQQALGGSLWYAHTGIASLPNDPEGRDLVGVGVRYRVTLKSTSGFRPFLAVPLEVLHSHIADRTDLVSAALYRVPQAPPPTPVEDRIGGKWGWGTGVEAGFGVGLGDRLSGQTSVQVLYQKIYESGTRNGAWNWHAGLSYALQGS